MLLWVALRLVKKLKCFPMRTTVAEMYTEMAGLHVHKLL